MENNLMLVNNVKQAALNCPGPAGFIIPSKFNYFLRKQLVRSLPLLLSNCIVQIANVRATCNSFLCTHFYVPVLFFLSLSRVMFPLEFLQHRSYECSGLRNQFSTVFKNGGRSGKESKVVMKVIKNSFVLAFMYPQTLSHTYGAEWYHRVISTHRMKHV